MKLALQEGDTEPVLQVAEQRLHQPCLLEQVAPQRHAATEQGWTYVTLCTGGGEGGAGAKRIHAVLHEVSRACASLQHRCMLFACSLASCTCAPSSLCNIVQLNLFNLSWLVPRFSDPTSPPIMQGHPACGSRPCAQAPAAEAGQAGLACC